MNMNDIDEEKPNTETHRKYYDNGKLKAEIQVTNGKPDGICRTYYENGQLMWECPYVDGKKQGISKHYDETGKIIKEISYDNDKELW